MNSTEAAKETSDFSNVFDDSKKSKLALNHYLDQYSLSIKDTEAKPNFISMAPQYRKRFYVPDDAVPQMMTLANACLREGIDNHLYEVQDVNEVEATGLMFDFKFETEQSKIEFETVISGFIRILFRDILVNWIAFSDDKEEHYCFYLSTANPHYDTQTLKFKSRFRIIIPSILLDSDIRFFIYQRVWQSKDMKVLFEKKLNYRIRDCFNREMRTSPIPLIGSCDSFIKDALYLESVLKVLVENGECDGDSVSMSSIDNRFENVIYEASINHLYDGGIVTKCHYLAIDACVQRMEDEMSDSHHFQMAYDEAHSTFQKQMITDKTVEIVHAMVAMLNSARFETTDSWFEIIKSLAADGSRYKCIAIMMTKNKTKNLVSWEEFSTIWDNAVNSIDRTKYSSKAIRYWAACDQPSMFGRYIDNVIKDMLVRDVKDSLIQGRIHHSHIASYLRFMFENVYVTHNVTKTSVHWYEFVTPFTNDIEPGQLYKWRCIGNQPDTLTEFISQDFKDIAVKVHSDLKSACSSSGDSEKDDSKTKHAKSLFKAYDKAIVAIFNNGFKRSVIDEATVLFKKNHFVKQLDKTAHILGVGNGVLEFNGPEAKLLSHYHTYPISLYTDTNYVPYDEDSKYVKTIYQMLHSLVPDDERDALDFLLYYFSTSLDWHTKESLFFIIHGNGSNGKSVIMELFRRTLGELYARKMPLSFITDQSRTRSSAADPAVMELRDARLVYYSESDRNEKVNVAKVKEITGGETLSGRQLYKEQENFQANCNHIVTTNHRFVIETTEHAVWRRFISYRFKICFKHNCDPENPLERPRDPKMIDLIMNDKRYQQAFLSILVHYRSMLYANYEGQILKVPHPTIVKETEEYRQSEDIFQRYIMQRVYYYKGRQQSIDELITNFRGYYRIENGEQYKAKSSDMIYTFRNSILNHYIKESGGLFTLDDMYSCNEHESPLPGSILFSEWVKQKSS